MEYSEVKNVSDTAFEEGEKKGLEKGIEQGIAQGIVQGMETGEQTKARKIAQGMLAEKLPLDLIAKLTGLTVAELESLN